MVSADQQFQKSWSRHEDISHSWFASGYIIYNYIINDLIIMLVEYVWLDVNGNPRSKTKVIYEKRPDKMEDLNLPFFPY